VPFFIGPPTKPSIYGLSFCLCIFVFDGVPVPLLRRPSSLPGGPRSLTGRPEGLPYEPSEFFGSLGDVALGFGDPVRFILGFMNYVA